jgi:hypothetical protein
MVKSIVAITALFCLAWPAVVEAEAAAPDYRRIRAALERSDTPARFSVRRASVRSMRPPRVQPAGSAPHDSVWNGVLIGAGAGGVSGYFWARNICGSSDRECLFRAVPAGILGGAGIGAAFGAIIDAFHR